MWVWYDINESPDRLYALYTIYVCVFPADQCLFRVFVFGFIVVHLQLQLPPGCTPRPMLQWRALRPVIDVSFSIIYCCILRLHSNPLMARTWPAIRRNQKLWYFWKFLLPAPAAPQNVSPSLSCSHSLSLFLSSLSYMPGRSAVIFMARCAAQWGRGAGKAAAGASIEPFLCDLITRNLNLFLWNMIVVKLFEVFL